MSKSRPESTHHQREGVTLAAMTTNSDPVTRFLSRFGLRDVGHALVAFIGTILAAYNITNVPLNKAALLAGVPTVAAVVFRQLFPHVTVSNAEVSSAIADVEHVLSKVKAPAALTATIGEVGSLAQAAAGKLAPPASLAQPVPVPAAPLPAPAPAATPVPTAAAPTTPVVVTPVADPAPPVATPVDMAPTPAPVEAAPVAATPVVETTDVPAAVVVDPAAPAPTA